MDEIPYTFKRKQNKDETFLGIKVRWIKYPGISRALSDKNPSKALFREISLVGASLQPTL